MNAMYDLPEFKADFEIIGKKWMNINREDVFSK
jgi:hypothetical protein